MKNVSAMRILLIVFLFPSFYVLSQTGPLPGDVYKEYAVNLKVGNNWRVTDPTVTRDDALVFLPNPVLSISIDDLEGAVRAEALMDIWGGHVGTTGKKFRFNNNEWLDVPSLSTTPDGQSPDCYLSQYNIIVDLPLSNIIEGTNTFEGNSGGQLCQSFNWGQWGWYVMIVRVYYSTEKLHTEAAISSISNGSELSENPELILSSNNPEDIQEVQYIAKYKGYDENGDGIYYDWHWAYHSTLLSDHVGTSKTAPFNVTWNTEWVPDQEADSISIMARVKDKNGVWFVTDSIYNLSLVREAGKSVKMYTARDLPIGFSVRNNKKKECYTDINSLDNAVTAKLFHRTWNAADDHAASGTLTHPLFVNENIFKCYGKNHFYALSSADIPIAELKAGQNTMAYKSTTLEHGIEVLWPGPALIVKYDENASKVATPVFETPSTEFTTPFYSKITCSTPEAILSYTIDRYDPHLGRTLYPTAGIYISSATTLKAKAFKDGMFESELAEADYSLNTGFYSTGTSEITLYPNPSNNFLNIKSDILPSKIFLIDLQGKKRIETKNTRLVDLNPLSNGLYLLKLEIDNQTHTFHILKN